MGNCSSVVMVLVRALSPEGVLFEAVPSYALKGDLTGEAHALTPLRQYFADAPPAAGPENADSRPRDRIRRRRGGGVRGAATVPSFPGANDISAVAADIVAAEAIETLARVGSWDVARLEGGLDDIVLATEYLQLAGAAPETGVATLAETLGRAGERGLLDGDAAAEDLVDAATLWQDLDGFFRMTCC